MKKIKRWLGGLCCAALLLALLTACGSQTPQQVQPDADGTYSSAVFDTQNDAGCLTVRYLALKETYRANDDKVNVGDCAVYTSPEGLVMMVDCSNPASFPEIDAQLKAMGVEKIDIFVMSHPHADHIGSFAELVDNYPIGQVYMNSHEYNSGTYRAAMEAIERNNIPSTVLRDGDSFQFGDQVTVKIYNPDAGMEAKLSSEYGREQLLTGDAPDVRRFQLLDERRHVQFRRGGDDRALRRRAALGHRKGQPPRL